MQYSDVEGRIGEWIREVEEWLELLRDREELGPEDYKDCRTAVDRFESYYAYLMGREDIIDINIKREQFKVLFKMYLKLIERNLKNFERGCRALSMSPIRASELLEPLEHLRGSLKSLLDVIKNIQSAQTLDDSYIQRQIENLIRLFIVEGGYPLPIPWPELVGYLVMGLGFLMLFFAFVDIVMTFGVSYWSIILAGMGYALASLAAPAIMVAVRRSEACVKYVVVGSAGLILLIVHHYAVGAYLSQLTGLHNYALFAAVWLTAWLVLRVQYKASCLRAPSVERYVDLGVAGVGYLFIAIDAFMNFVKRLAE